MQRKLSYTGCRDSRNSGKNQRNGGGSIDPVIIFFGVTESRTSNEVFRVFVEFYGGTMEDAFGKMNHRGFMGLWCYQRDCYARNVNLAVRKGIALGYVLILEKREVFFLNTLYVRTGYTKTRLRAWIFLSGHVSRCNVTRDSLYIPNCIGF